MTPSPKRCANSTNSLPTVLGRFAPSPSGPLHAGSALAAIGSYLSAKAQEGRWLLRIDDIDSARCRPAATTQILQQLEWLGLEWDGPIRYQSEHLEEYAAALEILQKQDLAYPCDCTRQSLAQRPCACRSDAPKKARAWRLDCSALPRDPWKDRYLGPQSVFIPELPPVLLRADGPVAYLLACVVDDAQQGITEVVRGADLAEITPIQQYLQQRLAVPQLAYGHLPLLYGSDGKKLSKSDGASAFDPAAAWEHSLQTLGWTIPAELHGASSAEWRDWALCQTIQK